MRTVIAFAVCIFGAAGVAQAAQIASPAIFGSHSQAVAQCIVVNSGPAAITITLRILNESGGTENSTVATLAPGQITAVSKAISIGVAYACAASSGSSLGGVRGALVMHEYVDVGGYWLLRPFRSAPLR